MSEWESIAFRLRGRPKTRWRDGTQQGMKITKIYDCKKQAKSRKEWKPTVEKARTYKEL
jgi:hypothetical protein